MKSDAEYKKLAYERTVLLALASLTQEFLLPPEGEEEAPRKLECEELPRNESTVPEDPIIDVVMKLRRLAKNRELEMSKFGHTIVEKNDEQEWSEEEAKGQAGAKGAGSSAGKGKGQGGGAYRPPAATQRGGHKPPHPATQQANATAGRRP